MSGYLETYRAGEERREKILIRLSIAMAVLLVAGGILWWYFRDYTEEKQIQQFLSALEQKDYKRAYSFWGCTFENPCRDYNFERFMEDWGPSGKHANAAAAKLTTKKSCGLGIIQYVRFPAEEVQLWVDRKDMIIGFAPWPICNPRMPKESVTQ